MTKSNTQQGKIFMKKTLLISALVALFTINAVADSTIGSVDGMPIYKSEAENAVRALSGGKTTYDKLTDAEKKQVVNVIAPSKMIEKASKSGLTQKEETAAVAAYWMQKKMASTNVSDAEAQAYYNKVKGAAKDKSKVPAFAKVKAQIIMQLKQEKIISALMKDAKIVAN